MYNLNIPYDDLETISKDNKRFYVTPNKKHYHSVTTMLGMTTDKTPLLDWRDRVGEKEADRITNGAAKRGEAVHDMCEQFLLGNENYKGDHWEGYVEVFENMKQYVQHIEPIYLEKALYSDKLRLAGRVDCIGYYKGELSIIDFKNSLKPKKKEWIENYWLQTTLYSLMFEELTGTKIKNLVIILGVDDEVSQLFVCKRINYLKLLYSKLQQFYKIVE